MADDRPDYAAPSPRKTSPKPTPPEKKKGPSAGASYNAAMREAGPFVGFGAQFAVTLGLLIWGGLWLDRRFETEPWGLLAGLAIGIASGVALFVKLLAEAGARSRRSRKEAGPSPGEPPEKTR